MLIATKKNSALILLKFSSLKLFIINNLFLTPILQSKRIYLTYLFKQHIDFYKFWFLAVALKIPLECMT